MTEKAAPDDNHTADLAETKGPQGIQPPNEIQDLDGSGGVLKSSPISSPVSLQFLEIHVRI